MAAGEDSTERPIEAVRHSEACLAGILEIAADAIISIDNQGRIILFNDGAERAFGYERSEILGEPLSRLLPERFREAHEHHVRQFAASSGHTRRMGERQEVRALHKSGREFAAEASISKLVVDGEMIFAVVLRDISERQESEAALRESEQRLQAFLDNSSVIGWMKDDAGRYIFLSAGFKKRFGVSSDDWKGKTDAEIWPPSMAEMFHRNDEIVLQGEGPVEILEKSRDTSGHASWWLCHKFPFRDTRGRSFVGCLGIDMTERIQAEEALALSKAALETRVEERTQELREEMKRHQEAQTAVARLQRMEALGQLTGGVAHDFNNLLTVITGNLQLMSLDISDPKLLKYLEEAERAAEMGARLNQRLMTFAKQRRLASAAINLNDQVIGVRELLRRSLGETISLTTDLADDLWTVHADPSEIENALVNLAINARDAMPGGGKLTVTTENVALAKSDPRIVEGLSHGDYVLLTVSDTGAGMSPEVLARAFEPFFTTKGQGKGTGLGLATIYGFVRQSGGLVTLVSEQGKGTTVNIYLPRLRTAATAGPSQLSTTALSRAAGETVLVVEDNAQVRRVTVERVLALGYRVVEAASGNEALALLESGKHADLVFSDVVMPGGISGFDLARIIRERWPNLPVLLTSGFAADVASDAGAEADGHDILSKPYSQAALEKALLEALNQGRRQTRTTSVAKT